MTWKRLRILFVVGTVIAISLLAVGASLADTVLVRATSQDTWNPATRTIAVGDRVVWGNPDTEDHTVTSYSSNWSRDSLLMPRTATARRFNAPGTYLYRCRFHSFLFQGDCFGMCGEIIVQ